jgi:HrpA-like RNA helicase
MVVVCCVAYLSTVQGRLPELPSCCCRRLKATGATDNPGFSFITEPSAAAVACSQQLLTDLGLLDHAGNITGGQFNTTSCVVDSLAACGNVPDGLVR